SIYLKACDTCRSRKQKCDEQRPKCSLCQRKKIECRYREPQPTKKDKTLVEILDRLISLEGKVDRLSTIRYPAPHGFGPPQASPSSPPSFNNEVDDNVSFLTSRQLSGQPSHGDIGKTQLYRHSSGSLKMLSWPAIQQLLLQSLSSDLDDLKSLEHEGSAFLVKLEDKTQGLPLDDLLQGRPFVGMQSQATRNSGGMRMTFPTLTRDVMYRLATTYFNTFNLLYPLLDKETFVSDTLTKVYSEGFDSDTDSVIALLVFALGEIAIEGATGDPIEVYKGRRSGIRGGNATKPPGLALFNEARKRIGFVLTDCELENVQIFSLAALTIVDQDFWRMSLSASQACVTLITCKPIDWDSQRGDLIKRAYWHCVIVEVTLNLELDLSLTELTTIEYRVGMPNFNTISYDADQVELQSSHFEAYYASQVALCRLCTELRTTVNDGTSANTPLSSTNNVSLGTTSSTIKQLSAKLAQWRGLLPNELQWSDNNPTSFPTLQPTNPDSFNQSLDPILSLSVNNSGVAIFTADLDSEPEFYPYIYDIQVALLRTRYYYTKYMVHQPFVYKALQFSEQFTEDDARGVAECLQSCIKWPIVHSPVSRRKRLVPYLFGWSQTFLSILLMLQLTLHNPLLRDIRAQFCGPVFEAEISQTIELMIDWIRDLKGYDSIAMWCWNVLQCVYELEQPGEGKSRKG
ncbi:hypothetical protein OIDMADRAFT_118497, partial [Oidiodendron maius Zn]